jgi:bifunctional non-homologous end joining protein LigD
MTAIAAGKGRGPKPFMLAGKGAADPGGVWKSPQGLASRKRPTKKPAGARRQAPATKAARRSSKKLPDFIPPQLCVSVKRPPNGSGWAHEIKFDGYRIQLRVEGGKATLKTRKGLDWTGKFGAIANAAARLPEGIIDGEIVALDANGAPDFAALQAALSERNTQDLIYFAFDLLFVDGEDLGTLPLPERKDRLKQALAGNADQGVIRFVEHFETGGEAVLRSVCKMSLEGIVSKRLDAPLGAQRHLDEGQVSRRARSCDRRMEHHQRSLPFAVGRRQSR